MRLFLVFKCYSHLGLEIIFILTCKYYNTAEMKGYDILKLNEYC